MKRHYSQTYRSECLELVTKALAEHSSREAAVVAVAAAMDVPVTTLRTWVRTEWGPARTDTATDTDLHLGGLRREIARLQEANRRLSHLINGDTGDPSETAALR